MRYIFGIKCILVLLLVALGTSSAHAYTVSCVSNAVQLNAALQHARNASDTTVIGLVQGTYDLSGTFLTTASANDVLVQFNAIKLLGGYDSQRPRSVKTRSSMSITSQGVRAPRVRCSGAPLPVRLSGHSRAP